MKQQLIKELEMSREVTGAAYVDLFKAVSDTQDARIKEEDARAAVESARNAIILANDPKELGSNEAQREARLRADCSAEYDVLNAAAKLHQLTKDKVALLTIRVDMHKANARMLQSVAAVIAGGCE